jgi:hypothetical protein
MMGGRKPHEPRASGKAAPAAPKKTKGKGKQKFQSGPHKKSLKKPQQKQDKAQDTTPLGFLSGSPPAAKTCSSEPSSYPPGIVRSGSFPRSRVFYDAGTGDTSGNSGTNDDVLKVDPPMSGANDDDAISEKEKIEMADREGIEAAFGKIVDVIDAFEAEFRNKEEAIRAEPGFNLETKATQSSRIGNVSIGLGHEEMAITRDAILSLEEPPSSHGWYSDSIIQVLVDNEPYPYRNETYVPNFSELGTWLSASKGSGISSASFRYMNLQKQLVMGPVGGIYPLQHMPRTCKRVVFLYNPSGCHWSVVEAFVQSNGKGIIVLYNPDKPQNQKKMGQTLAEANYDIESLLLLSNWREGSPFQYVPWEGVPNPKYRKNRADEPRYHTVTSKASPQQSSDGNDCGPLSVLILISRMYGFNVLESMLEFDNANDEQRRELGFYIRCMCAARLRHLLDKKMGRQSSFGSESLLNMFRRMKGVVIAWDDDAISTSAFSALTVSHRTSS